MTASRTATDESLYANKLPSGAPSFEIGVGLLVLVPLLAKLGLTIGTNTPLGPRLPLESIRAPIETATYLGPSFAAILSGVTADNERIQVSLVSAGVFGGLAIVAPEAWVLASVVLACASLLISYEFHSKASEIVSLRSVILGIIALAVVLSMIGLFGYEPALIRTLASISLAIGVIGLPAVTGYSYQSLILGLIGATVIGAIGLVAPMMTAAVSLLGMGIMGLPLILLVSGAAGSLTALGTVIEKREIQTAMAVCIILIAGVPNTVPTGIAMIMALGIFAEVAEK